jgi:hypothetical protein
VLPSLRKRLHSIKEVDFCLFVAVDDGLSWVSRKLSILDDELMQIISQEVSARISSVAIKYTKEAALWPVLNVFLGRRLHDIEHDADSVLVVVSDDSLVRIGSPEVVRCRAEAPQYLAPSASTQPASVMLAPLLVSMHYWTSNCGFRPQMTAANPKDNPSHVAHSSCLVHS